MAAFTGSVKPRAKARTLADDSGRCDHVSQSAIKNAGLNGTDKFISEDIHEEIGNISALIQRLKQ